MTDKQLAQIIKLCLDTDPKRNTLGWKTLKETYYKYVFNVLWRRCKTWKVNGKAQLIEDLSSDAWANIHLGLKDFRKKESKPAFLAWVKSITNNVANAYIRSRGEFELPLDDFDRDGPVEDFHIQEFYENMVEKLRLSAIRTQKTHLERDIQIFFLGLMKKVDPNTIWDHPCIGRFSREKLKKEITDESEKEVRLEAYRGYIQRVCSRIRDKLLA